MKRVLLDTNIYGKMILDSELEKIRDLMASCVIVYGAEVVRKEIRKSPRNVASYQRNLKMDLIRLYDSLVRHTIRNDEKILKLAENYYIAYAGLGGRLPKESIINDLIIVACASMKNLDLVVSEDRKTMLSDEFRKTYSIVNEIVGKRNPSFLKYEEFKLLLRRSLL